MISCKKKNIIVTVAVVAVIAVSVGILSDGFKRFFPANDKDKTFSGGESASNMLLFGISEAPYTVGNLIFRCNADADFRYLCCGQDGTVPEINVGDNVSSWNKIEDGEFIEDSDCRNIMLAATNSRGYVLGTKFYDYVPGIIYGESNPDQYDDASFYDKNDPKREDERAIKLASNLFKTNKNSYYGSQYGYIIQGYLTKYASSSGLLEDYFHTGTDFNTQDGRPFYSPIGGRIIYAGAEDDYHTIIIYDEEKNISFLILHGNDVSPAQRILDEGGRVYKGDLLGFGGSAGEPDGDTHLHIELQGGKASKYQSFSKTVDYSRINNYDPLIISDIYSLSVLDQDSFEPFSVSGTTPFNAQSRGSVVQVGNWIYYIDEINNQICVSRPDGSERKTLVSCMAKNLNYYDGWLFYSNLSAAGHLMKTSADGSVTAMVSEADTRNYVLVVDEWIYYSNNLEKGALYKVHSDGTNKTALLKRDIQHLFYYDNGFYYTVNATSKADRVHRFDLATGKDVQVIASRADMPFVLEGQFCYRAIYGSKNCLSAPLDDISEKNAQVMIPGAYADVQPGQHYIVFTNVNDANSIYIKLNNNDGIYKLTDDTMCTDVSVAGSWIYYHSAKEIGISLCRINVQSLKKQVLSVDGIWVEEEINCDERVPDLIHASRAHISAETIAELETTPEPAKNTPTPAPEAKNGNNPNGNTNGKATEAPKDKATATPNDKAPENTQAPTSAPQETEAPENTQAPTTAPSEEPKPSAEPTTAPPDTAD